MAVNSQIAYYWHRHHHHHRHRHQHQHRRPDPFLTKRGFTLVELLAGISLGVMISTVIIEALVAETKSSIRLAREWRESAATLRVLEMIRGELAQAQRASSSVIGNAPPGCGLSGRQVVLFMQTSQGIISYSLETNPENIWRNTALYRCGPDYNLNGSLSNTSDLRSSVVLDGLSANGVTISEPVTGILRIAISQSFANPNSSSQSIDTSGYAAVRSFE
jgi:prepilin-type N-terminal cleavage/methylation domain-containing protein